MSGDTRNVNENGTSVDIITDETKLATLRKQVAELEAKIAPTITVNPVKVDETFVKFVEQLKYTTKEVSSASQEVSNNILTNFLLNHYKEVVNGEFTTYVPKTYRIKTGNGDDSVKVVASASLTNNTNLVPCSLDLNYKPVSADTYDMDTKICFESTSSKYIDKLVASTSYEEDIGLGFAVDNSIANRTL